MSLELSYAEKIYATFYLVEFEKKKYVILFDFHVLFIETKRVLINSYSLQWV